MDAETDYRIQTGFWTHNKTKELLAVLGASGVVALLKLWAYATQNAWDGNLEHLSDRGIERAADWDGTPGVLVAQLRDPESQFLDGKQLHDWEHWQPWVAAKATRSQRAKAAAEARWQRVKHAASMPVACDAHADAMPPSFPLLSSPFPSKTNDSSEAEESSSPSKRSRRPSVPFQEIVGLWNQEATNLPSVQEITEERKRKMRARWIKHPDLDYWLTVFRKVNTIPFYCGVNDRGWRATFDYVIRNDTISQQILERKDTGGPQSQHSVSNQAVLARVLGKFNDDEKAHDPDVQEIACDIVQE